MARGDSKRPLASKTATADVESQPDQEQVREVVHAGNGAKSIGWADKWDEDGTRRCRPPSRETWTHNAKIPDLRGLSMRLNGVEPSRVFPPTRPSS